MKHARGFLIVLLLIGLFAIPPTSASPESDGQQPGPASDSFSAAAQPCTDLLVNGGFETGNFAGWIVSGDPRIANYFSHTYYYSAVLGYGLDGQTHPRDVLSQYIYVPFAAMGVKFLGHVFISTAEDPGHYDSLTMTVRSSGGFSQTLWVWNDAPELVWIPLAFQYFPTGDSRLTRPGR